MNIYDIAELAGVSIATVSRVVNGSPKVSEKTKQKVLSVMEEHNYTPNVFARGLGLGSMQTIGIICPDVSDAYMARAVAFLERRLKEYGYDCILYCSGHRQEQKEEAVDLLMKKRIDALVLVGSTYTGYGDDESSSTEYIEKAAEKIPVFLINGRISGSNIYSVYNRDEEASYEAVSGLLRAGRKRVLFLTDSSSYSVSQKMKGYERALQDYSLPVLEELKLCMDNRIHLVRDILLSRSTLEYDSVFATDDALAVGAVKYAHAKGLEKIGILTESETALLRKGLEESITPSQEMFCPTSIPSPETDERQSRALRYSASPIPSFGSTIRNSSASVPITMSYPENNSAA